MDKHNIVNHRITTYKTPFEQTTEIEGEVAVTTFFDAEGKIRKHLGDADIYLALNQPVLHFFLKNNEDLFACVKLRRYLIGIGRFTLHCGPLIKSKDKPHWELNSNLLNMCQPFYLNGNTLDDRSQNLKSPTRSERTIRGWQSAQVSLERQVLVLKTAAYAAGLLPDNAKRE